MLPWAWKAQPSSEGKLVASVPMVVTEETFGRDILRATLPAIVLFRSRACAASDALLPLLRPLAVTYSGRLVVASVDVDDEPMIASQYNVEATPCLIVFQDGEPMGWMLGFAAEGLLRRFFAEAAGGQLQGGFWRPTEQSFEEAAIVPLITCWGWTFERQSACALKAGRRTSRGRIDFLVFGDDPERPLTLFENKRLLLSQREAQAAAEQAQRYAQALGLSVFVVAAPAGMWVYRLREGCATLVRSFSSLEVHLHPDTLRTLLLQLGSITGTDTPQLAPDGVGTVLKDASL